MMYKKLLITSVLLTSTTAFAGNISLDYKGFYDRLKKVNKNDYSLIDMAFFVPNTSDCKILKGSISTEKKTYPLSFSANQQLYLPYDEKLKSDRALVNLTLAGDEKKCGVQMQIVAKLNAKSYRQDSLKQMYQEMDDLYADLQGFPLKYFSKGISGITFKFNSEVTVSTDKASKIVNGQYRLSTNDISNVNEIRFSKQPERINPWIAQ